MTRIINGLIVVKDAVVTFFEVSVFLLGSSGRRDRIIDRYACLFVGFERKTYHLLERGERENANKSKELSIYYLSLCLMYSRMAGVDPDKRILMFK